MLIHERSSKMVTIKTYHNITSHHIHSHIMRSPLRATAKSKHSTSEENIKSNVLILRTHRDICVYKCCPFHLPFWLAPFCTIALDSIQMHYIEEAASGTSTTATQHTIRQDSNLIQNELWIRLCRMSISPPFTSLQPPVCNCWRCYTVVIRVYCY